MSTAKNADWCFGMTPEMRAWYREKIFLPRARAMETAGPLRPGAALLHCYLAGMTPDMQAWFKLNARPAIQEKGPPCFQCGLENDRHAWSYYCGERCRLAHAASDHGKERVCGCSYCVAKCHAADCRCDRCVPWLRALRLVR